MLLEECGNGLSKASLSVSEIQKNLFAVTWYCHSCAIDNAVV